MKATLSIEVESIEELLRLVAKLGDTAQIAKASAPMDSANLRVARDHSHLPTRLREVCDVLTEQGFHSRVNIIVRAFENKGYISREEADTLYGKQDYRGFTMPINKACKAKGWDKCLDPEYGPGEGYRPALGFTIPAEYLAADGPASG